MNYDDGGKNDDMLVHRNAQFLANKATKQMSALNENGNRYQAHNVSRKIGRLIYHLPCRIGVYSRRFPRAGSRHRQNLSFAIIMSNLFLITVGKIYLVLLCILTEKKQNLRLTVKNKYQLLL